jgi:hypothetical protein
MANTQRAQLMANTMASTERNAVLENRFDSLNHAQLTLKPSLKIAGITFAAQQSWNQ